MNLIKSENPKLKMVSKDVGIPSGREIGAKLIQFLNRNAPLGVGLSAVQVGLLKRVFVIKWNSNFYICINPIVKKYGKKKVSIVEGCLSYPKKEVSISRPQQIEVTYYNGTGELTFGRLKGMLARIFQHEYDHLNGICKVGDGKQIKTKKEKE